MGALEKETFICFDCESTGLDPEKDRIVEIAAATFTFEGIKESREDLINPEVDIPPETIAIHHITQEMVKDKPKMAEVIQNYLTLIDSHIVVGHGISFDLTLLAAEAKRVSLPCSILNNPFIDTLRLARLYGESPTNSLEALRKHFNIKPLGAHRAMSDVAINIEVFKQLSQKFKQAKDILERLKKPVLLKAMPLGKHKGRPFRDIPIEYLKWASHQDFDQDLLHSLRTELKKRKQGNLFSQATNPFAGL